MGEPAVDLSYYEDYEPQPVRKRKAAPTPVPERRATSADYWALPEGRRAELIDGKLYDMAPPGFTHQKLITKFTQLFANYIDAHGGPCQVVPAPFGVNLAGDESTWVEPDVSVICDPEKISERGCEGAPDLVVEVVSPSSRKHDYVIKASLYEAAGVREYWIVDPRAHATTTYRFDEEDAAPPPVPFDEPARVGIFDGLEVTVADLL